MYLLHLDTLTVCQNERIPLTKSCFTFGSTSRKITKCSRSDLDLGIQVASSTMLSHSLPSMCVHIVKYVWGRCLALVYVRQGKYCE